MQLQVGVKVLIKNSKGLYLFIERVAPLASDSPNSWDIPGGRINPDESLADALAREVYEETGFKLTGTPKLIAAQDIFVEAKALHVVRLTYLTTEDVADIVLSDEHQNYKWQALDDIDSVKVEAYLKEVLDKLKIEV